MHDDLNIARRHRFGATASDTLAPRTTRLARRCQPTEVFEALEPPPEPDYDDAATRFWSAVLMWVILLLCAVSIALPVLLVALTEGAP